MNFAEVRWRLRLQKQVKTAWPREREGGEQRMLAADGGLLARVGIHASGGQARSCHACARAIRQGAGSSDR